MSASVYEDANQLKKVGTELASWSSAGSIRPPSADANRSEIPTEPARDTGGLVQIPPPDRNRCACRSDQSKG
jgi:hypothetical protein